MKKLFTLYLFIISSLSVLAQKVEYSLQLNSGLSGFRGSQIESNSSINEDFQDATKNYTNDPYGSKKAWMYGITADAKIVVQNHFIIGLGAGYEVLRSRMDLQQVNRLYIAMPNYLLYYPVTYPVAGYTILREDFINFNPYIGYRINYRSFVLDLCPGLDIAFATHSHESGQTMTNDGSSKTVKTDVDRTTPPNDFRLRFDLKVYYNHFGITAGYSRGLSDYTHDMSSNQIQDVSSPGKTYMDVIRIGISYRIY